MAETGLSSSQIPARNVGKVRNSGIEAVLSHANQFGDFAYNISFNIMHNKNVIEDLGEKVNELPPSNWIFRKGGSIGDFYMYQADGLYTTNDIANKNYVPVGSHVPEAGMIRYVDQLTVDTDGDGIFDKGDGVINEKDRVVVGNDVPKLTYGFNFDVSYKGFSLSVLGQGVNGVKVFLQNEAAQAFFDQSVPRQWQLDYWTPQNEGAIYPKLFVPSNTNFAYNSHASSFWLFDASYFRIKNITLSYTFPSEVTKHLGMDNIRVFFSGDNLFTFRGDKRMKDFDPEVATGRGYSIALKGYVAGISFSF